MTTTQTDTETTTARDLFREALVNAESAYDARFAAALDIADPDLRQDAVWEADDALELDIKKALWELEKAAMKAAEHLIDRYAARIPGIAKNMIALERQQ